MRVASTMPFWSLAALLVWAGCGPSVPRFARLEVTQIGWDTLRVEVDLERPSGFGGARSVEADSLWMSLFDASYDTLYAGAGPLIPVPDPDLGDGEQLLLEVCFRHAGAVVCEQAPASASPKRIRVAQQIFYPEGSDFERGRYVLDFVVERRQYEGDGWERIERGRDVRGYLLAYVEDARAEAVRVPFDRPQGQFDLRRHDNHGDFEYRLRSRLREAREARVHFDVYAGLGADVSRLAGLAKRVRIKTEAEREAEVAYFVEQAVEQLIDRLRVFERARVYVDAWRFEPAPGRYVVELDIEARQGWFRRSSLEGVLEVREDGTAAQFRMTDADRRMEERWERQVGRRSLDLDPLRLLRGEQDDEPPRPDVTSTW